MAKAAEIDKQMIKEAAIAYATAKNSMEFHGLGVTEHEQGSKTVMLNKAFIGVIMIVHWVSGYWIAVVIAGGVLLGLD